MDIQGLIQVICICFLNSVLVFGEPCVLGNDGNEQPGLMAPVEQCYGFRNHLDKENSSTPEGTSFVCCPVFQNEENCGKISQFDGAFSFDSREAKLDQFPWAAVVLHRLTGKIVCSGSLISHRYILSAAHCFLDEKDMPKSASDYVVRLGEWDLNLDEDCLYIRGRLVCNYMEPVDIQIESIINHEEFRWKKDDFLYDIALLKLTDSVEYSTLIGPACLPNWSTDVPEIRGKNFTATGWGRTRAFLALRRKFKLGLIGRNVGDCMQVYNLTAPETPRMQLCVGGLPRRDVCYGDSGGALMRREPDRWMLTGIVSFGAKTCGASIPGVYTNVARYMDWIQWAINSSS